MNKYDRRSSSVLAALTMRPSKVVIAVSASVGWMTVSSALIVLNKQLLSHGFSYPMALSGLGMGFSSIASFMACRVFKLVDAQKTVTVDFYIRRIMPVGFLMALTLHCGNLSYLYLTVAFIQMLKAFTPIITMVTLFLFRMETPNNQLIASVSIIAVGTLIASIGEGSFSTVGVIIMMSSEVFESLRLVMTQVLLVGLKFNPIEGLMYLAPACTIWLAFGSLLLEWPTMKREGALGLVATHPWQFLSAAAMGFGVNSLAYIVIQTASSLTLKVLGTVKNSLVVCLGIVLFSESVSLLQGFGYVVSVAAFVWYQKIKMAQMANGSSTGAPVPASIPAPPAGQYAAKSKDSTALLKEESV